MYSSVIIKVIANKNSFQTVNDTISAVVKKTGQDKGRATLVNNCITDAPSNLAASKIVQTFGPRLKKEEYQDLLENL